MGKLSFKVSKTAILQYLMLYILYGLNGARWFVQYQYSVVVIVLALFMIMAIRDRSLLSFSTIWFPIFLLVAVFLVRMISGGIGIDMWELYASQILIVYMVFHVDAEMALTRYVKFTTFMALISIGFWIVAQVNPGVLTGFLTLTKSSNLSYYGLWLYTLPLQHVERNTGIFTEPGRYQTVVCSAVFILAFLSDYLYLNRKKQRNVLVILIITILTIQSTTGFLSLIIIVVGVLLLNVDTDSGMKKKSLIVIAAIAIVFLMYDYWTNGTDSILESRLFNKIETTDANDKYSSGGARMRSILACLEIMLSAPWGAGITNINKLISSSSLFSYNTAGAGLMTYFTALGIIPAVTTIIWIIRPFFKNRKKGLLIVFLALYINIGFAQTYAFYPALIMVPVFLSRYKLKNKVIHTVSL